MYLLLVNFFKFHNLLIKLHLIFKNRLFIPPLVGILDPTEMGM
jgi:hypothetical protein